jgi:hypothetical protein
LPTQTLEVLEHEGVIVRHVGRGTFLAEAPLAPRPGAPPDTSPAEIMQVRLVLEPPVAALAARVATQTDLDRIGRCLDRGGETDGFETFESWDARLHRAIAEAAHNGLLMSMFDVMNTARQLPVWGSLKRRTSTPSAAAATTRSTPRSSTRCATATRTEPSPPCTTTCTTSPTTCSAGTDDQLDGAALVPQGSGDRVDASQTVIPYCRIFR